VTVPTQPAAPQAIPVPADFPVHFEAGEEQLFWEHDRMHFPGQVTKLEAEVVSEPIGRGITAAFRHYELPMETMRVRTHHGYTYNAMVPVMAPPEELEELGRRGEARLLEAVGRLGELWDGEWLPEILRHLGSIEAIDLRTASLPELVAHLDEVQARMRRLWEIHFQIVIPSYIAVSEFDELFRDLFDGEGFDAYRLLQGFPSKTTEIGCDLWRLSRVALAQPEVAAVLEIEAAADVPAKLRATAAGRDFLAQLDVHLQAYGHRGAIWGLASRGFLEDPAPVLKMLKDYLGQPDGGDPARELERLTAEREAAIARARERLQGYPAPVVGQFEAMLEAAQVGYRLTEDHGFYIDAYAVDLARQVLVEIGRRLTALLALEGPDDVLMLTLDEIRAAASAVPAIDCRTLAAQRQAELERYAGVTPPPALGTLPPGPPPDNPIGRFVAKFWGAPPAPAAEAGVVTGAAGSAGTVTAVARVVRSLEDAGRLAPGEVLVAETTAPSWTPLFAVAAAVVTDTGGILSHCAVVAREYGIPAVVGTGAGTAVIADGDLVEVDGDAGTVRIVG
jgi:phosphohistidine swiveling domain-containing protein